MGIYSTNTVCPLPCLSTLPTVPPLSQLTLRTWGMPARSSAGTDESAMMIGRPPRASTCCSALSDFCKRSKIRLPYSEQSRSPTHSHLPYPHCPTVPTNEGSSWKGLELSSAVATVPKCATVSLLPLPYLVHTLSDHPLRRSTIHKSSAVSLP